jgi:hypothetical protein
LNDALGSNQAYYMSKERYASASKETVLDDMKGYAYREVCFLLQLSKETVRCNVKGLLMVRIIILNNDYYA